MELRPQDKRIQQGEHQDKFQTTRLREPRDLQQGKKKIQEFSTTVQPIKTKL